MLMAGVLLTNALVTDAVFLVYSAALLTRLFYHGARYFQDGFNNFDILHVSVSLFERVFFGGKRARREYHGLHIDRGDQITDTWPAAYWQGSVPPAQVIGSHIHPGSRSACRPRITQQAHKNELLLI